MAILNRKTLKNFFKKGSNPTEMNFSDFIDSTVNKIDDGLAKSTEEGLQLSPVGTSNKVMSFYKNIIDKDANWTFSLEEEPSYKGLSITNQNTENPVLFLSENSKLGIGTRIPKHDLEVSGSIGMKARIGTYAEGLVRANGAWQTILSDLDACVGFEIMARVGGAKGRGKYAIAHILALRAYGKSNGKIKINQSYFGWFLNKIQARWIGDINNFSLQIRTMTHYGLNEEKLPFDIQYQVTKLWDDSHLSK